MNPKSQHPRPTSQVGLQGCFGLLAVGSVLWAEGSGCMLKALDSFEHCFSSSVSPFFGPVPTQLIG